MTDEFDFKATQDQALAELLARDPEGWARLRGMMAILALPRVRGFENRPRIVEVDLRPLGIEVDAVTNQRDWYQRDGWLTVSHVHINIEEGIVYSTPNYQMLVIPAPAPRPLPWRNLDRVRPPTLVEDHAGLTEPWRKKR